jgi:hypothetical protein
MNLWKISTIALAIGMTTIAAKDAFPTAQAAPQPSEPGGVAWDWGAEQPHMQKALEDLRGARHSLEVAAENKGGWRVLALKHTDEALNEVIRGMEYGKNHPRE